MAFAKLFKPIKIGKVSVKNRIVMLPIDLINLTDSNGLITQRVIDFYVERAKGGVGLIITGNFHAAFDLERLSLDGIPLWPICSKKALPRLGELAEYVHSFGSKIFIQLSPGCGRNAPGEVIDEGLKPISASAIPSFYRPDVMTRPLTKEEIRKIVKAFGRATEVAVAAGMDGIEIHGHEGYLLDQFTTALWNKRTDEYGGDLVGMLRFPREIINVIKETAGKDFPVIYRFGLKHFIKAPGNPALSYEGYRELGADVRERLVMSKQLEEMGVDALDVDAGCYDSLYWAHPPIYSPHGCLVNLAAEVKKVVNIPVIAVGRLDIPEIAEEVLDKGMADMIGLGRGLLADPYWPKKVQEGRIEDILPCIGCHDGCFPTNKPLSCSVNPSCGRERLCELKPASKSKKVLIVGGGVAGMEAARVATIRGHKVILYEKNEKLGGHLIEASIPEFKRDIKRLLNWYITQLKKLKIEIKLNTEVTEQLIEKEKPDAVIIATGSKPIFPEIPIRGDKPKIIDNCSLLLGKEKVGDRVIIYGGGLEGCETALWLAKQGKRVTIVARHNVMPRPVFRANREMLLDLLAKHKVQIITHSVIKEAGYGRVVLSSVEDESLQKKVVECDTIVVAIGLKSERKLFNSLKDNFVELYLIGDAKEPRKIHHAIWDGFIIGTAI
ncbi:MAG: oxidoreductase [Candidatus Baldrarchaeia archaeon]